MNSTRLLLLTRTLTLSGALALALSATGCRNQAANRDQTAGPSSTAGTDLVTSGEAALIAGDRKKAAQDFARAIAVNPNLTDAHLGLADINRMEGDYAAAEAGYRKAADLAPQNFDAQYYNGLMLHLMDRVTDAIGAYLRALAVRPDDFQANLNISAAYYQLGENAQALAFGERAVRLNPRSGPAHVNLAAILSDNGNHADAVVSYQQAAEYMELTPKLLLGYAESLKALDRYTEMRGTLEQLVRTTPSAPAHERLGYALFKLEQYDQALANFQAALNADPNYFPALNGVGVCELNRWYWSDQRDSAARERGITALRKSLTLNNNQAAIQELLGRYR